jgi:hypothetical protein
LEKEINHSNKEAMRMVYSVISAKKMIKTSPKQMFGNPSTHSLLSAAHDRKNFITINSTSAEVLKRREEYSNRTNFIPKESMDTIFKQ